MYLTDFQMQRRGGLLAVARRAWNGAKEFDLYPDNEPYMVFSSPASRAATWVAMSLICYTALEALLMINQPEHRTMTSKLHSIDHEEAFKVPAIAVLPGENMRSRPYSFNESWYRVVFRRVEWGQSGDKDKTYTSLGGQRSQIFPSSNASDPLDVWAPDKGTAFNTVLQGQFEDETFVYLEIVVQPCYLYEEELWDANRSCASRNDIDSFFCTNTNLVCSNEYNTFSLYISNRQTLTYTTWDSPIYVNLEPHTWLGVEVVMRAVSARVVDIWGTWSASMPEVTTWLKFQSWYSRRSGTRSSSSILKFYLKVDGTGEKQVYTDSGFEEFFLRVGSYWSFLGISVGLLAWTVNKWISCCHKAERKALELQIARRHRDLLGLELSERSLRDLEARIVPGSGGRTSLRTKSGMLPLLPAEIQVKPTHYDVWNDDGLAERPYRMDSRVRPSSERISARLEKAIERQSEVNDDSNLARATFVDQLHAMENEIDRIRTLLNGPQARVAQASGETRPPSLPPQQQQQQKHFRYDL